MLLQSLLELLRGALLKVRGQASNNSATAGGQIGKEQIHSAQIYLKGPILAARAICLQNTVQFWVFSRSLPHTGNGSYTSSAVPSLPRGSNACHSVSSDLAI